MSTTTKRRIQRERATATAIIMIDAFGSCRICGCNNLDCRGCIELFGRPCHWANARRDICSACEMG